MLKRNINLFVKLLLLVIFVILLVIISVSAKSMPDVAELDPISVQRNILIASPKLFPEIAYSVYFDPEPTQEFLEEVNRAIKKLELIDLSKYTCEASILMLNELSRLKEIESQVVSDLTHYLTWEKEHYFATKVWEYFRQRGFNNEVTCAIIGNMMIETSGGSLNLKPSIYGPSGNYYGLCQWSQKYYSVTKDLPFEYQLDYLLGSMPWEFNTFGKNYKSGFNYEDFIAMSDTAEAALAFAKSYERCGPASYKMRQEAAIKAYKYFDLDS